MTEPHIIDKARELVAQHGNITPGPWIWQDGNSWRRLGTPLGDGDILRPEVARDGWPTIFASSDDRAAIADVPTLIATLHHLTAKSAEYRDALKAIARTQSLHKAQTIALKALGGEE